MICCSGGLSVPYSNGNITFAVLSASRPQAADPYNSSMLEEFMMARAVRLTMNGHYYVDETDTRHQYYAIYEITVTARYDSAAVNGRYKILPRCTAHSDYLLVKVRLESRLLRLPYSVAA